eukprot:g47353.t1
MASWWQVGLATLTRGSDGRGKFGFPVASVEPIRALKQHLVQAADEEGGFGRLQQQIDFRQFLMVALVVAEDEAFWHSRQGESGPGLLSTTVSDGTRAGHGPSTGLKAVEGASAFSGRSASAIGGGDNICGRR